MRIQTDAVQLKAMRRWKCYRTKMSDIRGRNMLRGHLVKNLHGYRLNVLVEIKPTYVFPTKKVWFNNLALKTSKEFN